MALLTLLAAFTLKARWYEPVALTAKYIIIRGEEMLIIYSLLTKFYYEIKYFSSPDCRYPN